MAIQYDSSFSGAHNDNYDARLTIIEEWKSNFLNTVYPVGSIYMSMSSTNPHDLFGGTWAPIYGRMLLGGGGPCEGNTHNNFGTTTANQLQFSVGEMGGELQHTLTTAEMPSHVHIAAYDWASGGSTSTTAGEPWAIVMTSGQGDGTGTWPFGGDYNTHFGWTGGSGPHNNMPPYLGVYMWKRTA